MEKIFSEPTSKLPLIDFNPEGTLLLKGVSIPEDAGITYRPLIDFVDQLDLDHVTFDINLTYFNTSTSKRLMDLLKHLDANNKIKTVLVNWMYEEGDEDSVETAQIYEESLRRIDFRYQEYIEENKI
jgi:hypothetical protein